MSPPTIRDEVLAAWRQILLRANCRGDLVDALVLELAQACEGHGQPLLRIPRPEDPNAVALGPKPPPGDYARGLEAARAQLRPPRVVDTRADRPHLDRLPEPPEIPEEPE